MAGRRCREVKPKPRHNEVKPWGAMRSFSGDYPLAFMTSDLACLSASLLALRIKRLVPAIVPTV